MIDIKDIKKKRFEFLQRLYEESDGDTFVSYYVADIGAELGFDRDEAEKIAQYLHDEGLVEIMTKDRHARITHRGIQEVEEAIENPDKPTQHFLPVNVIQVGQMVGSQITQASPGAIQLNILTADDRRKIEEDLALLKEGMERLQLPPEQESDLSAEIETIEAQMKSSKPKREVIKAAYGSIRTILLSAAGGVAAHFTIQLLSGLHF